MANEIANCAILPLIEDDGLNPTKAFNNELYLGKQLNGGVRLYYKDELGVAKVLNSGDVYTTPSDVATVMLDHVNVADPHPQYQHKVNTDDKRWEMLPKGIPTMLFPLLTDEGNLTTWLTNHPKWKQCNGSNSTPDLRGKFIIGSDTGLETTSITGSATTTGGSKDAVVVAHNHNNMNKLFLGQIHVSNYAGNGDYAIHGADGISIPSDGVDGTNERLPPYYSMVYVIRTIN